MSDNEAKRSMTQINERASITDELMAIRDRWHTRKHPFARDWRQGKLNLSQMSYFVAQHRHHAEAVLANLGVLLTKSSGDARRFILENLAEEEGVLGGGLGERDAVSHTELMLRFTRRCGPSDEETYSVVPLPGYRARTSFCVRVMHEEPAEHFMAMMSVSESQAPGEFAEFVAGLVKHHGFDEDDPTITFFTEHLLADVDHGNKQTAIAEKYITTAEARAHVLSLAETLAWLKWNAANELYDRIVLGQKPALPDGATSRDLIEAGVPQARSKLRRC